MRLASLLAVALVAACPALAQVSPLETVMDGRTAASTSNLTEAGMTGLAQATANVVMYTCGALAIALTAFGLLELYRASDGSSYSNQQATTEGGVWKLVIAGLVSIPAIVAAIVPYALL